MPTGPRLDRWVAALLAPVPAAWCLAGSGGPTALCGGHALSWLPATSAALAALVLLRVDRVARWPGAGEPARGAPRWTDPLLFAVAALVFWIWIDRSRSGDFQRVLFDATHGVLLLKAEPLGPALFWLVARVARGAGLGLWPALAGSVIVAGAAGVVVLRRLAFALAADRAAPGWLLFAALCGTGSIALFFGHVETYTVPAVWMLAALLAGVRSLERGTRPHAALLFWGLACAFHMQMLCLAPAIAWLCWSDGRRRGRRASACAGPLLVLLALGALQLLCLRYPPPYPQFYGGDDGRMLVPLARFGSLARWRDLLMLVLMSAPGALVLLPFALRAARLDAVQGWLTCAAAGWLGWMVLWDPDLGAAQDWDLFAGFGFLAVLACGAPLARAPTATGMAAIAAAALVGLGRTLPFVLRNHAGPW